MLLLKDLLEEIPYECSGNLNVEITDVVYDSRKVVPGCVFVCLCGSKIDSHEFAADAEKAGAVAIVAQHAVTVDHVPVVLVENTRRALAFLSAAYFDFPAKKLKMVGITGTKGKTTTTYMVRSILENAGIKTGLIGTIGVVIGDEVIPTENTTPESYEIQKNLHRMVQAGCQAAIMEASSIGLRDHRIAGFQFDIGLFTNFSEDHIGGAEHSSMEEYMACKAMLFQMCKIGIVNLDDSNWEGITAGHTCMLESFGCDPKADLRAENERLLARTGFLGVHFDLTGTLSFPVDVAVPGHFSVHNALAAIAICKHFGVSQQNICEGLLSVKVKGRVEPVEVPGNYTLLIDYAHNAVSMENILNTLRAYHPNRLICMFGAGGNRSRSRRYEMGEVSGNLADLSVITADNSRFEDVMDIIEDIKIGMHKTSGEYIVIPDRREAIQYCMEHAQDGDIIVLAGKGHEDYQEINGVKHHFDEREVIADILAKQN